MTIEDELRTKLESIRESIIATKFATESLLSRVTRIESDLYNSEDRIDLLSDKSIRTDETMKVILKSMGDMSTDLRAVRNSVLSTIVGASIIWALGTAFTTFYTQSSQHDRSSKIQATVAKNA